MNGIMIVLTLLSGVALFLYGMSLMGDGLKRVAGNQLELVLYKLTNTPIKGVLLGTIVTAIIQSSSATTVMVVGFVNSGMMKVAQAIGIIMGANIGTSVTGWILFVGIFLFGLFVFPILMGPAVSHSCCPRQPFLPLLRLSVLFLRCLSKRQTTKMWEISCLVLQSSW